MKPIRFLPLFFCISTFTLNAQTLINKVWEQATGHPTIAFDHIATARQGTEVFIVGNTYHFGEQENFLITKYNTSGVMQWQKEYNSISSDRDFGMDAYIKGTHLYVTGFSWDSASNDADLVTLKLTLDSGNIVWTATYAGAYGGYDAAAGVRVDNSGNVYVAGSEQTGVMDSKIIVVKYNSSGTQQWVTAYDSTGYFDGAVALDMDPNGNRLQTIGFSGSAFSSWDFVTHSFNNSGSVTGYSRSANPNGGISKPVAFTQDYAGNLYVLGNIALSPTNNDIKLIKYDTLFNQVWVQTFGCADSLDDEATAIAVDGQGRVIISGFTSRSNGATDMLTLKYDKNGSIVWSRTIASPDLTKNATGRDVKVEMSAASTIYVAGKVYNNANYDYLTASYTKDGDLRWVKYFDYLPGSNDVGIDIVVDSSNYVYVSGICVTDTTPNYVTVKYKQATTVIPTEVDSPSTTRCFFENRGQILINDSTEADSVFYYTNNGNPQLYIGDKRLTYVLAHGDTTGSTDTLCRIDMRIGTTVSNSSETVFTDLTREQYLNYYLGVIDVPITYVRGHSRILQKEVYRDIDWQLFASNSGYSNYFIVKPNTNGEQIELNFSGTDSAKFQNKQLTLYTRIGNISFDSLMAYSIDTLGNKTSVIINYVSLGGHQIGFDIDTYNTNHYLIIKMPMEGERVAGNLDNICWSTYYGGHNEDEAHQLELDPMGNLFAAGRSITTTLPYTTGLIPSTHWMVATLSKFNSNDTWLWTTVFGGSEWSFADGIAIRDDKHIFVHGITSDTDFPQIHLPSPAYSTPSGLDALTSNRSFITRFNSVGNLFWSEYFSGHIRDLEVDNSNNLYIVGGYSDSYLPLVSSSSASSNPFNYTTGSAYITKLSSGFEVIWSTPCAAEEFYEITEASNGSFYAVGYAENITTSTNFEFIHDVGEYSSSFGGGLHDAIIVEFDEDDNLLYSTFVGGSSNERFLCVTYGTVNNGLSERLYIGGITGSSNFPTLDQNNALPNHYYQNTWFTSTNANDGILMVMDPTSNTRIYATYLGGTNNDQIYAVAADDEYGVFVVGGGYSNDLPTGYVPAGYYSQAPLLSISDGYIFNLKEGELNWATYLGGSKSEWINGAIVSQQEELYVCGTTNSAEDVNTPTNGFPIFDPQNGATVWPYINLQNNQSGFNSDAFYTKFCLDITPTSAKDNVDANRLIVYPNPTSDFIFLNQKILTNLKFDLDIFDVIGQRVLHSTSTNDGKIDVSNLTSGVYLLKITTEGIGEQAKFVKQ